MDIHVNILIALVGGFTLTLLIVVFGFISMVRKIRKITSALSPVFAELEARNKLVI